MFIYVSGCAESYLQHMGSSVFAVACRSLLAACASQVALVVRNQPANARDVRCRVKYWVGKIPEDGHGNSLQYSRLKNLMERSLADYSS